MSDSRRKSILESTNPKSIPTDFKKVPEAGFEPATLRFLTRWDYESYALTKLSYPGTGPYCNWILALHNISQPSLADKGKLRSSIALLVQRILFPFDYCCFWWIGCWNRESDRMKKHTPYWKIMKSQITYVIFLAADLCSCYPWPSFVNVLLMYVRQLILSRKASYCSKLILWQVLS